MGEFVRVRDVLVSRLPTHRPSPDHPLATLDAEDIAERQRLPFQRLVKEEQIGENGPHVARGVQVVHQLRSDRGLSEHEPDRGHGVSRVVIEHAHERVVWSWLFEVQLPHSATRGIGQAVQRLFTLAQELADLAARCTPVLVRKSLRGVGEHELVRLFDRVAARGKVGSVLIALCWFAAHDWLVGGFATCQRSGSWCSRY